MLPWQWAIAEAQSWPLGAAETTRSVRNQGAKDTGPGFPGNQSRPKRQAGARVSREVHKMYLAGRNYTMI